MWVMIPLSRAAVGGHSSIPHGKLTHGFSWGVSLDAIPTALRTTPSPCPQRGGLNISRTKRFLKKKKTLECRNPVWDGSRIEIPPPPQTNTPKGGWGVMIALIWEWRGGGRHDHPHVGGVAQNRFDSRTHQSKHTPLNSSRGKNDTGGHFLELMKLAKVTGNLVELRQLTDFRLCVQQHFFMHALHIPSE